MPRVGLVAYQEDDGSVPLLDWFDELAQRLERSAVSAWSAWQSLATSFGDRKPTT